MVGALRDIQLFSKRESLALIWKHHLAIHLAVCADRGHDDLRVAQARHMPCPTPDKLRRRLLGVRHGRDGQRSTDRDEFWRWQLASFSPSNARLQGS